MSEELLARLERATNDAEKHGKEVVDGMALSPTEDTEQAINFLAGWILELEGILGQAIREIDSLAARLDEQR